jgi:ferric-dicitrate binding protein FerR (iron transport regulator)
MINISNDLWILLARYISGNINATDTKSVENWLSASEKHQLVLRDLSRIWQSHRKDIVHFDSISAFKKIKKEIQNTP